MATRNDITGDELKSGSANDAYREGWERIFGKKPRTVSSIITSLPTERQAKIEARVEELVATRPQLEADIAGYPETDEGNAPD